MYIEAAIIGVLIFFVMEYNGTISLTKFLNDNNHVQKTFIIINSDNINMDNQRKLSYMVKDKTYQNLYIPVSCKIIVIGNKEKMNKELLGLLLA